MLRLFFFRFFLLVSNLSLVNAQNSFFELNGEVLNSKKGDKIYLSYKIKSENFVDSLEINQNSFFFKGKIDFPVKAFLSNGNKFRLDGINSSIIYLEPKKAILKLDYNNFKNLSINKYKTYDEYLFLEKEKKSLNRKRDSLYNLIQINRNQPKSTEKTSKIEIREVELEKIMEEINSEDIRLDFDFVSKNKNSFICPDLLLYRVKRKESTKFQKKIDSLFNTLNDNVKKSYSGTELKRTIENLRNSRIGEKAPNFILKDINHNLITLNEFKGNKIILLDFWATWCAPCRDDFTYLKDAFKLYSDHGFEIISISKDDNVESWKRIIKKEEIDNWKHILIKENYNNHSNQSKLEEDYFVNSIPVKVLINKDGIIIGRWRGGGNENLEELNRLLLKIFKQ